MAVAFGSSRIGRSVAGMALAALVVAGCGQSGGTPAAPTPTMAGSSNGPTANVTPAPATTGPSAQLALPAPPTGLTAADISLGDISRCLAEDAHADGCLSLAWTPPAGQVDGYRIYIGRQGGTVVGAAPSGWYDCPQGGTLAIPQSAVPAGTTSYMLPLEGEYPPVCVAVSAFNAAGESPWAIVMVESDGLGPVTDTWQTYQGDGYSVAYPGGLYDLATLARCQTASLTYAETTSYFPVGPESKPELLFGVEHLTFQGAAPFNSGPDLAAFVAKTLAYYAPYLSGDGTVAGVSPVTVDGHAGFAFTVTTAGGSATAEVFLAGDDLFAAIAGGATSNANSAGISKFIGSLRFAK
jgi:hypothetical protein